ncbi:MAG: rhomboid family intramembrane serine protease [Bacteroidia bacterium]
MKSDFTLMLKSSFFAVLFIALMWCAYLLNQYFNFNAYKWGVFPRTFNGFFGIFCSPFIHNSSSYNHIISNTFPMLVLTTALFYFYREIAFKVFFGIWLISGLWLWILSRPSYHIGASVIIYGLAFFLFFSGWIRRSKPLMGLSLLVAFLYGSMLWGLFPIDWSISFEGHAYGATSGIILAYYYKKQGPQREVFEWENEEEEYNNDEIKQEEKD